MPKGPGGHDKPESAENGLFCAVMQEILHVYPWPDGSEPDTPADTVGVILNHPYTADLLAMLPDECGPLLVRALGLWLAARPAPVRAAYLDALRLASQDEDAAPSRRGAWTVLQLDGVYD